MGAQPVATPTARRIGHNEAWARYADNLVHHLIGISRDLERRVTRTLGDRGHRRLRPSFAPILYLIWDEGRSVSAIADELGISRQATSHTVSLVENAGYVERRPNPADGRSKLVVLTSRGRALVEQGAQIILKCESDYADLVGPDSMPRLANSLAALREQLGLPAHLNPVLTATARNSIGALILVALGARRDLMSATLARGHTAIRMSHHEVLALIGPDGARVNEIARIQGVSRQAISATVQELETFGYLHRQPDRRDRRGVVFTLTDRGAELIEDSLDALDALASHYRGILDQTPFEQLRQIARDLHHALQLHAAIDETGSVPHGGSDATNRPAMTRSTHDLEQLAGRLRRWLGRTDATRLAVLLAPQGPSTRRDHQDPSSRDRGETACH